MLMILEELWCGKINLLTRKLNRGTNYEEAFKMMCKNGEKLKSMLKDKEREIFEKFCECRDEVDLYNEESIFIIGFRLGARIIIESLYEPNGFFGEIGD